MNEYSVYKHTAPNGKVYIGITARNPVKRWSGGNGYRNNTHFWNAIVKYGWDNIRHEILFGGLSKEEATDIEKKLIAEYRSNECEFGYNRSSGGEPFCQCRHTDETRQKLSEAMKGENNPNFGHVYSEASREKMRRAAERRWKDLAQHETLSKIRKGVKNKNARPVMCVETGIVYETSSKAAQAVNAHYQNIAMCCNGKQKTVRGYHWKYVN